MSGQWNISGYRAGGGRQSLTYNLKASQFRGMGRPNIFQSSTYIQNNYYGSMGNYNYGYDYGCCGHNCNGGMSKFTQWMMGIGMGLPLIGNILEMFMPKKAEGAGNAAENGSTSTIDNTPKPDEELKSYQEAYKDKCTIVKTPDGKYLITPKDGLPVTVDTLSTDIINEALGKKSAPPPNIKNDSTTNQGDAKNTDNDDDTVKGDEKEPKAEDITPKKPARRAPAGVSKKPASRNGQIDKSKAYRLNMVVDTKSRSTTGTATVVTPDGKTYKVNVHCSGTIEKRLSLLSAEMQKVLKEAGWTNVTLQNNNLNWASDGKAPTEKVDKPNVGKIDKTAKIELTIAFAVRSGGGVGNSGSATVTTPDGQVHQVTTGISLTAARARKDLAKKMQELLKQTGWTNVTLKNDNFDDWH